MAGKWIKGNTPKKQGTYLITMYKENKLYVPWEFYYFDGNNWSRESKYQQTLDKRRVLAYMNATVPEHFIPDESKPDDKISYFVRVDYGDGRVSEYGLNSWPKGRGCNKGYDDIKKARAAISRRKKVDIEYGYTDLKYSVVDNLGNEIEKKRK